ncbi:MAG: glycosyltransferase family 4 protein [Flavobacteriales bacterium]
MKILYHCGHPLLNYRAPTGYGRHMRGIVGGYEKLGHQVSLSIAGGEGASSSSEKGEEPHILKKSLKRIFPAILWESLKDLNGLRHNGKIERALRQKIESENPDLIHERVAYLHDSGVKVAKEKGIPVILELDTPFREAKEVFEGPSLLLRRAKRMEEWMLGAADGIMVVSSAIKAYYTREYGIDEKKIMVTPNAIDPDEARGGMPSKKKAKEAFGIDEEQRIIGFVGSIFPYHGVDLLLKAYYELLAHFPETVLLIVGDGEQLPELKRMAMEQEEARVIFTGKLAQEKVLDHIAAMDLAVLASSHWFNSPVKLFEYGMLGKPVLAPDVAGVRDVVEDGKDGRIMGMNEGALLEGMKELLEDPEKAEKMGRSLQEKVMNEHTWEQRARDILKRFGKG